MSPSIQLPSHRDTPPRRGFALVITISLMILLVLIGVGMLTLSSISLRTASQETAMATARANARLALMLALGDLQRNAGPDQRVTARAEILDSNPSTTAVDSVKQPYWTAVWNTGPNGLDRTSNGASPQRKLTLKSITPTTAQKVTMGAWLVSNPNPGGTTSSLDPTTYTGNTSGTTPDAVMLAKGLGADHLDVTVPLVNIRLPAASYPSGRYGYWVSDEGVKAKVNLVDPTMASGVTAASQTGQAHFLAPQANAIHKISGLVNDPQKDFRTENPTAQLNKIISSNTINLLKTSPTALNLKTYIPDVTAYSVGVLADVKHGGLKKDLTAAFENTAMFDTLTKNYGYGKKSVYRNYTGLTVPTSQLIPPSYEGVTDALPWTVLYSYYNIYKDTITAPNGINDPSPSYITPVSNGSVASLPYQANPRMVTVSVPVSGGRAVGKYGGLVPEVLAHRTDIALDSYSDYGGHWKLRLRFYPLLVLYNPYNCRLAVQNFQMQRNYATFGGSTTTDATGKVSSTGDVITVMVDGKPACTRVILNQTGASSAGRYALDTQAGQCDSLEPGETRMFALEGPNDVQTYSMADAINFAPKAGRKGLCSNSNVSDNVAQWCYMPTWSMYTPAVGTTPGFFTNGSDWAGTTDPSAVVEVTSYRTQLTGGAADTFITPDNKWPSYWNGRILITAGPDEPAPSSTWAPISIGSLVNNPRILTGFFIRKKGVKLSTPPGTKTYLNGGVVIPLFHGNAPYFTPFDNVQACAWEEFYINKFGINYVNSAEVQTMPSPSGAWETYFGAESVGANTLGASTGTAARHVLRDIPDQPLVSIGQFMHMPTMVFATHNDAMPTTYGQFGFRDTGSMFIGGSLSNPFIPTSSNLQENTQFKNMINVIYDDSFLANETLFDRFFFSTVPPASPNSKAPPQWTDFNNAVANSRVSMTSPLPNARIKPYGINGAAPLAGDVRDFDKAAANLMLDGAFNVNSTSVNAWKALLSSLSGNDMQVFKSAAHTAGIISKSSLQSPIPRFWSSSDTGNVKGAWDGNRALSEVDVTALATSIVQQVKLRGPFLCMSDFLNRRLGSTGGSNPAFYRAGCLQAAIDNTNINSSVKATGAAVNCAGLTGMPLNDYPTEPIPAAIPENLKDGAGNVLTSAVGMPGYLMQQDVVQAFSPAMTVRSDTFVVRAYGECVNPVTGEIQAKAWAEAVVQRLPAYVDQSDAALIGSNFFGSNLGNATPPYDDTDPNSAPAEIVNKNNINFGRRFNVFSFRWLSPNEL